MLLSCSGHDTILDHPVLGACKVTEIYYRYGVINAIPLANSSSQCPLRKLVSTNQSTDVYKPVGLEDSVLVACQRDFVPANQDEVVGPSSCLSLSNNASQFWYLVHPETDMSTLPVGYVVVASGIPIPYSYDKNGRRYYASLFRRSLFKENAYKTINFGETSLNWSINNITSICQRCEQDGHHCGFSSYRGQAFCQRHGLDARREGWTASPKVFGQSAKKGFGYTRQSSTPSPEAYKWARSSDKEGHVSG